MKTRLPFILVVLSLLAGCGSDPTTPDVSGSDVLVLTNANFDAQVLQSPQLSLVDFYMPSCSACASMAPIVENLATRYRERVVVGEVDVSRETLLADRYSILYVPTFVFIKNGAEMERIVGGLSEADLAAVIDYYLAAGS
jgi:thioredoxin 1